MSTNAKPFPDEIEPPVGVLKRKFCSFAATALVAVLSLAGNATASGNLLQDGDFNGSFPGGWTTWTWNGGWIGQSTTASEEYDATPCFYCGGGSGQSAGLYQYLPAVSGIPYTISCDSAVNAWWWPDAIMRMTFFDASNNQLLSVETNCAAGITDYDIGLAWSNYTFTATSPANTTQIKVEFTCDGQGTIRFDNAVLTAPINPPVITNIYPNGAALLQGTNTFAFTAVSTTTSIDNSGFKVVVNGTDVSSNLTITGSSLSKDVVYSGLLTNKTYTVYVQVTDAAGLSAAKTVNFDTYSPILSWEAEDYDFGGGQFINNPAVNAYANQQGSQGVDYYDNSGDGPKAYRPNDLTGQSVISDTPRSQYVAASASEYDLEYFHVGYWADYTRTVPAGTYNVYGRFAAGGGTSYVSLGVVTNGFGTSSQTVQPLGTFAVADTGSWGTYAYTALRDQFGNLAQVTVSGQTTFQALHFNGSDLNMNFFMLVPADTTLPTITQITPQGWFQSTNTLKFVASSSAGIATSNIVVTLNGQTITNLVFTGSSTNWNVSCPLAPSTAYSAVITVTGMNGAVATTALAPTPVSFDTFSADSYAWEVEDYDYNSGLFIDNPQVNAYFGFSGTAGVDFFKAGSGGNPTYRGDAVGTEACGDTVRSQYSGTGYTDYDVNWTGAGDWFNYTRTYPTGKYNVYLRAASPSSGMTMGLQRVTSGWGTSTQTTNNLGAFTIPNTGGWQSYAWSPLTDSNGKLVTVALGGTNTLRLAVTSGGPNLNFLLLAPALEFNTSTSGGNINLSFGTQSGFSYTVLYKSDLTDSAWTVLNTVAGDGTVKTISNAMTDSSRFYLLQAH